MRKIAVLFTITLCAIFAYGQTLGDAGGSVNKQSLEILNKVNATYKDATGIEMDLKISLIDNKTGKKGSTNGNLKTSGNKFNLTTSFATMIFDGKTLYVYDNEANELTASNPDKDELSSIDPTAIISMFQKGFKIDAPVYDKTQENVTIKLFPEDKKAEYALIEIKIATANYAPKQITTRGKNGVENVIDIKKIETGKNFTDETFTFNFDKYKNLQFIDLR